MEDTEVTGHASIILGKPLKIGTKEIRRLDFKHDIRDKTLDKIPVNINSIRVGMLIPVIGDMTNQPVVVIEQLSIEDFAMCKSIALKAIYEKAYKMWFCNDNDES